MSQYTELPQIALRALEPEDLDLLYDVENDTDLWNVGSSTVSYSRYALNNYIIMCTNDIYVDKQVRLVIENEKKDPIGIVDVFNFDGKHNRAEVGIVLNKFHRGYGYAQAAILRLIDYAKKTLHLHQLYVFVSDENEKSFNLFERCGFEHKNLLKDWVFNGNSYSNAWIMQLFL